MPRVRKNVQSMKRYPKSSSTSSSAEGKVSFVFCPRNFPENNGFVRVGQHLLLLPKRNGSDGSRKADGISDDVYGAALVNEVDGKFYGWVTKQDAHIIIPSLESHRIEAVILEAQRFQWADAGGECISGLLRFVKKELEEKGERKESDDDKEDDMV